MSQRNEHKTERQAYEGWAVLQIMHRGSIAGYLTEHYLGDRCFLQLSLPDVQRVDWQGRPTGESIPAFSMLFNPDNVDAVIPTTESVARSVATRKLFRPIKPYELAAPAAPPDDDDKDKPQHAPLDEKWQD